VGKGAGGCDDAAAIIPEAGDARQISSRIRAARRGHRRRHGTPNVLRGLRPLMFLDGERHDARSWVAVVATSAMGVLRAGCGRSSDDPPGDIRNCLAALCDASPEIADVFQYRFGTGDGLNGHAIGNLVIAALTDVTNDSTQAVMAAGCLRRGVALPATSEMVHRSPAHDGRVLSGEPRSRRPAARSRVWDCFPSARAARPGRGRDPAGRRDRRGAGQSLHQHLPPLSSRRRAGDVGIARVRILVANLTEAGETDNFSADHLLTIERHLGRQLFDCVIY
jgi:hypothetical protein